MTVFAPDTNSIANNISLIQQGMPSTFLAFCKTPITASGNPQTVTPVNMPSGLTVGSVLNIDVTAQENITLTAVTGNTFTAVFTKDHGLTGDAWTVGSGALTYSLVKIGAVTDPTDVINYCSITFDEGKTEPLATGWRVRAHTTFQIESGFDMSDGTVAEQSVMTVRDVLLPIYSAKITLNAATGVYLTLLDQSDRARFKAFPNGRVYRIHQMYIKAALEYNVMIDN